jgi:hypothetical protein
MKERRAANQKKIDAMCKEEFGPDIDMVQVDDDVNVSVRRWMRRCV